MPETKLVLGLGFGDEGKGRTVSYLASLGSSHVQHARLIVRFNGGHQAGHTVQFGDKHHVFSSFGSGSLQEVPTYISRFCTIYPFAFLNEWKELRPKVSMIQIYIDPLCQITTPFDVSVNQRIEGVNQHGSCGVGFGTTVGRAEKHYNLFAQDLLYPSILRAKLDNIMALYRSNAQGNWEQLKQEFLNDVEEFIPKVYIKHPPFRSFEEIIFEGAQGIMLDQDFGFFPNVTRSYCTSRNALEIVRENNLAIPTIYYVHRVYQTRHGVGFMTNEGLAPELKCNEKETNIRNTWQGKFRKGMLDVDLMRYALQCDRNFHDSRFEFLVLTCVDQVRDTFSGTARGKVVEYTPTSLYNNLTEEPLFGLLVSEGPETTQMHNR